MTEQPYTQIPTKFAVTLTRLSLYILLQMICVLQLVVKIVLMFAVTTAFLHKKKLCYFIPNTNSFAFQFPSELYFPHLLTHCVVVIAAAQQQDSRRFDSRPGTCLLCLHWFSLSPPTVHKHLCKNCGAVYLDPHLLQLRWLLLVLESDCKNTASQIASCERVNKVSYSVVRPKKA